MTTTDAKPRTRGVLAAPLLAALLGAVPSAEAGPRPQDARVKERVGTIDRLQVTGLTRSTANVWVHVTLPRIAEGSKQTFSGKVEVANVSIPIKGPITVMVQKRPDRNEAVFIVDLVFKDVPQELLGKVGSKAIDIVFDGTLTGEHESSVPAFAVGLLKYGTHDIEAPVGSVSDFVTFEAARLTGVSLAETKGEAAVKIFNPFSFPIPIRSISYKLTVGERQLCSGEKKGFRIHPTRENDIRLAATASNADLVSAAGSAVVHGGTLDGRLSGAIVFAVGKGDITLPIDLPGKIQVGGGQ